MDEEKMVQISQFDLAQLRHAYALLKQGHVKDQAQFADGILAPIIRKAEKTV